MEQWTALPFEKRDYCVKELVETEKNYIEALNMIVKHFVRPLKSVISQKDRHILGLKIRSPLLFLLRATTQHDYN